MFYFHVLVTPFCKIDTYFLVLATQNKLKCILKHVIFQYYAMKSKNFLVLMIDLNNIYEFNILRYILWIISKKIESVSN
jgi:hypothetical protein